MKKILLAQLLLLSVISHGQDIHFSQFAFSPLLVNPAMAGANYQMEINGNYKEQWGQTGTPFKTYNISMDMRINDDGRSEGYWVWGMDVFSDKAGDSQLAQTSANLVAGYQLHLDRYSTLGLAVIGGYNQMSVDYLGLTWGSQYGSDGYDPGLGNGENRTGEAFSFLDVGAGLLYSYKSSERYMTANDQMQINAGFSAYHLTSPKYSFLGDEGRLHRKYVLFGNALFGVANSPISLVPSVLVTKQGPANEVVLGTQFRLRITEGSKYTGFIKSSALSVGAHHRFGDSFILSALLEIEHYAIGVSYDLSTSALAPTTNARGGLELTFRFATPNPFGSGSRTIIGGR